jgi:hypothetical protein
MAILIEVILKMLIRTFMETPHVTAAKRSFNGVYEMPRYWPAMTLTGKYLWIK